MKLAEFTKLKKLMGQTASENDHEALAALRAANRVLATNALTWERVLSRTVNVIAEVEEAPDALDQGADGDLIEQARRATERSNNGRNFVNSVSEQFHEKGFITVKQRIALRDIIGRQ